MAEVLERRRVKFENNSPAADFTDEDLLDVFLSGAGIESQEAFSSLVARHGPMVLGTCRHVLGEHHDAEDAFQATFLVLARKGATIRNRRVLAGWLHEVAHRIAVKARAGAVRRRDLEKSRAQMSAPAIERDSQDHTAAWNELRPLLHAEVERLPERYRTPVILSYLEGKTNEEVAALLGWPVGTVKGRLSRARDLLRSRLVRRGLSLSIAFVMTALSRQAAHAEVVSAELSATTVERALKIAARSARAGSTGMRPIAPAEPAAQQMPTSASNRAVRSLARRAILVLAVFLLSLTASLWIGSAVAGGGDFIGIGRAMSVFQAAWSGYSRTTCH
jgi:RNA polymerase sigma factor (sigma-70 family)